MSVYEVTTEDGSVYEVTTEDVPAGPVDNSSSWKDATLQAHKNLVTGALGVGDVLETVANPANSIMRLFGAGRPAMRETYDKRVPDTVGGDAADVIKAAQEASVFPVGGPVANAAAGIGAGLAEKLFPGSKIAPVAGALVPALGAEGLIMAARGLSPKVNAGKVLLSQAGNAGEENLLAAIKGGKTRGAVGPLTYAEIADTPSAAAFQQSTRKVPGPASELLEEALARRQAARVTELQGQAPDALLGVTPAERGAAIQPKAADITQTAIDEANAAYKGIGNPDGIDLLKAKFSVGSTAHNLFANNPIPMNGEAAAVLEAFRAGPRTRSLAELDGLRQAAGRVIGKLSIADKRAPEISLMESIRSNIDNAIEQAIQAGAIEPKTARALEEARFGRKFAGQKYESAPIRAMTKKGEYGEGFKMASEDVIPRLTAGDKEADSVLAAFGGDKEVMQQVRGGLLDQMAGQGTRNYQAWPRFYQNKKGVFEKIFFKDAPKVKAILDDIASENRVQELASRASKGQSATAQYATAAKRFLEEGPGQLIRLAGNIKIGAGGAAAAGWASGNPAIAGLAILGSLTAKQLSKRMEIWVARGMADPEVLSLLASKATANNLSRIGELFIGALGAGTLSGEPSEGVTESPVKIAGDGGEEKGEDKNAKNGTEDKKYNGMRHTSLFSPSSRASQAKSSLFKTGGSNAGIAALFGGNASKKNGADMELKHQAKIEKVLPALIKQESAGDSKATSPKGAMGLMQVMPGTFKEVAARIGLKNADPYNKEHSLQVGTAYLDQMLEEFGGDLPLALAAYNAGPNRVKKLQARKNLGKKFADIYPQLPAETQQYVLRILSNAVA